MDVAQRTEDPIGESARVYAGVDLAAPELIQFASGRAAAFTVQSPGKTTGNEDAVALIPFDGESGILAVADGLGGLPGGNEASRVAMENLAQSLERASREEIDMREAILNGIENANKTILAAGLGAATTLAVVELQGRTIRPYHVGDSVILVTGQRGKMKHQNIAHSPVGYAVEAGVLDESEALHHEERHVVSNVVGSPKMRIEIGPRIRLAARDTLVIASDGLSDNLYVEEIVERVRTGPLASVAVELVRASQDRMQSAQAQHPSKKDDLTFLIFRPAR